MWSNERKCTLLLKAGRVMGDPLSFYVFISNEAISEAVVSLGLSTTTKHLYTKRSQTGHITNQLNK